MHRAMAFLHTVPGLHSVWVLKKKRCYNEQFAPRQR